MRPECMNAVSKAIGRNITPEQAQALDRRMLDAMRQSSYEDIEGWRSQSPTQRLMNAANRAAENAGFDAKPTAPWISRTINQEALRGFHRTIASGDPEQILKSPVFKILEKAEDQTPSMTLDQLNDPKAWDDRSYSVDGQSLDRDQYVDAMKSRFEQVAGGPIKKEKTAIILTGQPGAGKSTTVSALAKHFGAAAVDMDAMREGLPEYDGGRGSAATQLEAGRLRDDLISRLMADGSNFISERVGNEGPYAETYLKAIQEAGYKVVLANVSVDFKTSLARAAERMIANGRLVRSEYLRKVGDSPRDVFAQQIADHPDLAHIQVDANGPRGSEKVIKAQGIEAGAIDRLLRSGKSGGDGGIGADLEARSARVEQASRTFHQSPTGNGEGPGGAAGGGGAGLRDDAGRQARDLDKLGLFSAALEAAKALPDRAMKPEEALGRIAKGRGIEGFPGSLRDEMKYLGLREEFAGRKRVTKAELIDYIQAHRVMLDVVDQRFDPKKAGFALRSPLEASPDASRVTWRSPIGAKTAQQAGLRRGPGDIRLPSKDETLFETLAAIPEGPGADYEAPGGHIGAKRLGTLFTIHGEHRTDDQGGKSLWSGQIQSDMAQQFRQEKDAMQANTKKVKAALEENPEAKTFQLGDNETLVPHKERDPIPEEGWSAKPYEGNDAFRVFMPDGTQYASLRAGSAEEAIALAIKKAKEFKETTFPRARLEEVLANFEKTASEAKQPPLTEKTSQWTGAAVRAMVVRAAREGFDSVSFPTGETSGLIQGNTHAAGHYDTNVKGALEKVARASGGDVRRGSVGYGEHEGVKFRIDDEPMQEVDARQRQASAYVMDITPKMRAKLAELSLPLFQTPGKEGPRGSIQFPEGGMREGHPAVIKLFEAHDLSSFLHESGHYFLEVFKDLASRADAPEQLQKDFKATLDWMGLESGDQIGTEQHEKFAEAFEKYLMTAEAPSAALRGAFDTFKSWLSFIYRRISNIGSYNADLSPEIKGVMDRLLASEDEIKQAESQQRFAPMFKAKEDLSMNDAQWARYTAAQQRATAEAESDLTARLLETNAAQREAAMRVDRGEIRDAVTKEIDQKPEYVALRWLSDGHWPLEDPEPEAKKINRQDLIDSYGKGILNELPRGKARIYAEDGQPLDMVAGELGYGSADEMIHKLRSLPSRTEAISTETEARLQAKHGADPLKDGTAHDLAMKAAHNEARSHAIELEMEALARATGRKPRFTGAGAKTIAKRTVRGLTVREVSRYDSYLAAERKAAAGAQEAFRKGDLGLAEQLKLRQLLNFHLWREARRASDEMDRYSEYARKFDRPGVRKNIDPSYLQKIDNLLDRFNFKRLSQTEIYRREQTKALAAQTKGPEESLLDWKSRMEATGFGAEVAIDSRFLSDAIRQTDYTRLSVDEMRGLRDSIKNLEYLGRHETKIRLQKKALDRETAINDLQAAADSSGIWKIKWSGQQAKLDAEGKSTNPRALHARLTRMEFLLRRLDGDKDNGPWHRLFFDPVARSRDAEIELNEQHIAPVGDILRALNSDDLWKHKVYIKELDDNTRERTNRHTFLGSELLSVALNWGNEYNREALIEGGKWRDEQIQAVLSHIPKEYWDAAQSIWDELDKVGKKSFDMQERLTGVRPEKVEFAPFFAPHGERYRGGYYPVKYDGRLDPRQAAHDDAQALNDQWGGASTRAQTKNGHLIARKGGGGKPVRLGLSVLTDHMSNVIHDIAFRETVTAVNSLLSSRRVQKMVTDRFGVAQQKVMVGWLKAIAGEQKDPSSGFDALLRNARGSMTIMHLGLRLTTSLLTAHGAVVNMTRLLAEDRGLLKTGSYIGELARTAPQAGLAKATQSAALLSGNLRTRLPETMKRFAAEPQYASARVQFAMDRSPLLRERFASYDRDTRDMLNSSKPGVVKEMKKALFYMNGLIDTSVAVPTWHSAYDLAMEGQVHNIETGDEADAIAYANQVIRTTLGANNPEDLPPIMRGTEGEKLMTSFFGFFNMLYNRNFNGLIPAIVHGHVPVMRGVGAIAFGYIAQALLPLLVKGQLTPQNGETDKDYWRRIGMTLGLFGFETIPLVREGVSMIEHPGKDGGDFSISPVEESLGAPVKAAARFEMHREKGEPLLDKSIAHDALDTAGLMFGLPTDFIWNFIDYTNEWMQDGGTFDPYQAFVRKKPKRAA